MLKSIILGSSIAFLSALSLPAIATDWRTTGVSTRTRETVAIDMDSINRVSRYDVRFRYLIGKDLVQASVNCDSSLVTPDQGKPFVPDMTGATREMIKLACGERRDRASATNYDRGYGHGSRQVGNSPRFAVSRDAIAATRRLSYTDFAKYRVSDEAIIEGLTTVCRIYSNGGSKSTVAAIQSSTLIDKDDDTRTVMIDFYGSIHVVALSRVCPEYDL
ncbi:MAG: hypothetical protein J0L70_28795 [Leptolyngbya sp. UWPOB_LEPTO1]|uniref:hypothetical protein n=1 Tax=Leptolyngbya sp. UWPOB_LEPTO1 TaxID=2815653 RepID=UPI001ACED7E9|nr:hypothetical protein [Leptolyngbya sp. UWPOB_LEPTO1]MBN8564535.1 hypothetical protein [Leptolyngbya sp. UWPOB_LEPTO1]